MTCRHAAAPERGKERMDPALFFEASAVANGPIGGPLFVIAGEADKTVRIAAVRAAVEQMCIAKRLVTFRSYPGLAHDPTMENSTPDQLDWIRARCAGKCGNVELCRQQPLISGSWASSFLEVNAQIMHNAHQCVVCELAVHRISATDLARNTREILDKVASQGETMAVERNHIVIARIVPPEQTMLTLQPACCLTQGRQGRF